MTYRRLLMSFRLILGSQRSIQIILEARLRRVKGIPLQPQGSLCPSAR